MCKRPIKRDGDEFRCLRCGMMITYVWTPAPAGAGKSGKEAEE
nr:MAG TPA: zinc ribbon domain protein [Caudoviricetes sp.]DAH33969.1 MAG TPA: zinc ribbon domain protein [Caudoviricetes sp.]